MLVTLLHLYLFIDRILIWLLRAMRGRGQRHLLKTSVCSLSKDVKSGISSRNEAMCWAPLIMVWLVWDGGKAGATPSATLLLMLELGLGLGLGLGLCVCVHPPVQPCLMEQHGFHRGCSTWNCNYSRCFCAVCVRQRPDEEVVVDQGGTSSVLNIHYEKEELEGKDRRFVVFWNATVLFLPSIRFQN